MKKFLVFFLSVTAIFNTLLAQDNIILRNGEEVKAKVQEVGISEIKYKKFDNLTGPLYTVLKSDVFIIKYENGSKEVFGNAEDAPTQKVHEEKRKALPATGNNEYKQDRKAAIKKIVGGAIMTGIGVPVLIAGVALTAVGISSFDASSSGNVIMNGPSIGLIATGAVLAAGGIVLEVLGPITLSRGIKARRLAKQTASTLDFKPIYNTGLDRYNYALNRQTLGVVTFTF